MVAAPRLPRLGIALTAVYLIASLAASPASAATFRVGGGAGCTHATLADAVAAAAANGPSVDNIYIAVSSITLATTIDIDNQAINIIGGFTSCATDTPTGETQITVNADPGFHVHGGTSTRFVTMARLRVIRGASGGRLLRVTDRSVVTLETTVLSSGHGADGGNVWMSGPDVIVWVTSDSSVYNGDATGVGGGVYCGGGATFLLDDGGSVGGNHAAGNGGGVYLDDCTMNDYSGVAVTSIICPAPTTPGVVCNTSGGDGGGIYATNGAALTLLGGNAAPALLGRNDAGRGGALYMTGATTSATLHDAWLVENLADTIGGGIYARAGAQVHMDVDTAHCKRGLRCSLFQGNLAGTGAATGGAIAVDGGAQATVLQTTFTVNTASIKGSVAWAEGVGTSLLCEGCLSYANTGSNNEALFESEGQALLRVAFSTIDESNGCCRGLFDTATSASVQIFSSILMALDPGTGQGKIFEEPIAAGEGRLADCILRQESIDSLPPELDSGSYVTILDPQALFLNRSGRDYRLPGTSAAVDFCDTFRYTPVAADFERDPRGADSPVMPNHFGPYDLGVDESVPLFADAYEAGIGRWSGHS